MQSVYEIFEYSQPQGVRIFLHKANNVPLHWHAAYEFLMILDGECSITTEDTVRYKENDLVLINAYEPHSVFSRKGAVILALQVKDSVFGGEKGFDVDSERFPEADYSEIKTILAQLIKLHSEKAPGYEILMQSLILRFKYILVTRFRTDAAGAEKFDRCKNHIAKLSGVLDHIQNGYHEELTLNDTAKKFYFSPAYLSRLFEKTMGVPFKKYVDSLRFNEAMNLLFSTDKSVDAVAEESGFPNTRAFVSLHKQIYGCVPSEHRKSRAPGADSLSETPKSYMDFKQTDYLSRLAQYLPDAEPLLPKTGVGEKRFLLEFDAANGASSPEKTPYPHTEKTFCCVGRAADFLKENVREMLRETQKKIGFTYIKFHGLFDDALGVYSRTSDGRIIVNFNRIDEIIDFLLSVDLRPLLQLSFMPGALAKHPEKTTFFLPLVTSEPQNLSDWAEFIKGFTAHLLSRYGEKEVGSWLFSVWNEAETPSHMFGFADPSLFKEFFRVTYHAVKEVFPAAKFGTASFMYETLLSGDWFEKLYGALPDCPPDFINLHFYPVKTSVSFDIDHLASPSIELFADPDILSKTVTAVRQKLSSLRLNDLPVYLTEWNSTTSHRDLLSDTAFKGAYVVYNVLQNYDRLDSFGYWSLTDDILELPPEQKLFHGGHGLFTQNGIKKPPFYAFWFLSMLKGRVLGKGRNFIITEDERGYAMLFCNYIHYSDLYAAGELFDADESNRYAAFRGEHIKLFDVTLKNTISDNYVREEYVVNRTFGSVYDVWKERFSGEEPAFSSSEEELRAAARPKYETRSVRAENGDLRYLADLAPHEIRFVRFTKK